MRMKGRFKVWEVFAIAAASAVVVLSFVAYLRDFPVLGYLIGIHRDVGKNRAGRVAQTAGTLRRQLFQEIEFRSIERGAEVFDRDTIITSSDGTAVVNLDDGGVIELGPGTMVRLTFEKEFSLSRILEGTTVQVLTGRVTGRAKTRKITFVTPKKRVEISKSSADAALQVAESQPPVVQVQMPEIAEAKLLVPAEKSRLFVQDGSPLPEKAIAFSWKVIPPRPVLFVVRREGREVVRAKPIVDASGAGSFNWTAKEPGNYQWELLGADGTTLKTAKADFEISPDFVAIGAFDAVVVKRSGRSKYPDGGSLRNFGIKLSWRPYRDVEKYQVKVGARADLKMKSVDLVSKGPEIFLSQNQIIKDQFFYRVSAVLDSGFIVSSRAQKCSFPKLPPALTTPSDGAQVSRAASGGSYVLLTWQGSALYESYDVQVSNDSHFLKLHSSRSAVKRNFVNIALASPGKYWWRVRGNSGLWASGMTEWSKANTFTTVP